MSSWCLQSACQSLLVVWSCAICVLGRTSDYAQGHGAFAIRHGTWCWALASVWPGGSNIPSPYWDPCNVNNGIGSTPSVPVAEACWGPRTYSQSHTVGMLYICEILCRKIQTHSTRLWFCPWHASLGMQYMSWEGTGPKDKAKVLGPHGRCKAHLWRILHTGWVRWNSVQNMVCCFLSPTISHTLAWASSCNASNGLSKLELDRLLEDPTLEPEDDSFPNDE